MFLWEEMTMSSIRKKIEYLEATKKAIRDAILDKGKEDFKKVNGNWQEGKNS